MDGCFVRRRERKRGTIRSDVLDIGALHSSRVGSLDKRTKGQLFGGGKDSWSSRPQRHDALGRSGYFPATAHRLKIESPAKVRERLFKSTIRSRCVMLDVFRSCSSYPERFPEYIYLSTYTYRYK